MKYTDKYTTENIYDDFMEEPANIRSGNQVFSLREKTYYQKANEEGEFADEKGGFPVWADEDGRVYVDNGDTHTLVIGATGSKKTRLIVMPSVRLLGWAGENMIISDPKAEIYTRTAGELEKQGYRIVILNFRDPSSGDTWNPLAIPYQFYRKGDIDRACEMVNDMARNIILPENQTSDPFWTNSAADLFFGLVMTLFKLCVEKKQPDMAVHFGNVIQLKRELFENGDPSLSDLWIYVQSDEIIAPALSGIVLTARDTRGGIISTFDQSVRFLALQPNLMDMLANHTLALDDIYERKMAIYLILPDEKTTYHALVSLFIKQSYEYLIFFAQNRVSGRMPIRLNYILDEFSALPTIKDFPAMITAARSRNIRFCLIIQSKHQLKQRYQEETETIQSNCGNWIFLTSREVSLLEEISKLCGRVNKGQLPLISIFDLQHLNKERGQALMLCGRKRPYFAYLPDIDAYDGKAYLLREAGDKTNRKERKRIHVEELIHPVAGKETRMHIEPMQQIVSIPQWEYATLLSEGMEAYEAEKYEQAKECWIHALNKRPANIGYGDCENNLACMLRRKEINEVVFAGRRWTVQELLQKGVAGERGFSLVNMALYVVMQGETICLQEGEKYILKIHSKETKELRNWWEKLAARGELEGYIVIYWLYRYGYIEDSEVGSREDIEKILGEQYGIVC